MGGTVKGCKQAGRKAVVREFLGAYERMAAELSQSMSMPQDRAANVLRLLFYRLLSLHLVLRSWRGSPYLGGGLPAFWDDRGVACPISSTFPWRLPAGWPVLPEPATWPLDGEARIPSELVGRAIDLLFRPFAFSARESEEEEGSVELGPEVVSHVEEQSARARGGNGVHYTPRSVVLFMVRRSLASLIKARLVREPPEAVERLVYQHDPGALRESRAVLELIQSLSICDPACGTGSLLSGMLDELLALRISLGEDAASVPALKARILQENLHGVDVDPAAAAAASLRLWLGMLAGGPHDQLPPAPAERILTGDSLLDTDSESWRGAAEGGFDIVIMNPPYLSGSRVPGGSREAFRAYSRRLRTRYGFSTDLYVHFFYRGLELVKPGGVLCALTSASFLSNLSKVKLRLELLEHDLQLLAPMGSGTFDARVYPCVTLLRRKGSAESDAGPEGRTTFLDLRQIPSDRLLEPGLLESYGRQVEAEEYRKVVGAVFFDPTPKNRRIFRDLLSGARKDHLPGDCPMIAGVRDGEAAAAQGAESFGRAPTPCSRPRRFAPLALIAPALDTGIHSGNVRDRLFFREPVSGRHLFRLLQGTQVLRYVVWWENPKARYRYVDIDYRPDPSCVGKGRSGEGSGRGEYWHFCGSIENHHVTERLLMRQTGDRPVVAFLRQGEEPVYTDNTVHTLILTNEGRALGFSYRYLVALLNSGPLAEIYMALAQEENRMLAQVRTRVVNLLPLPVPADREVERLEWLVDQILSIHTERGLPLSADRSARVAVLQAEIDRDVSRLYGLSQ